MRTLHRLSLPRIAGRKTPGYHADGGGLYLRVTTGVTMSWIFRFTLNGRTRDVGLGAYPAISLAKAREQAEAFRRLVAAGVDPIEDRRRQQDAARRQAAKTKTFEQCVGAFIGSYEPGWRNDKHRAQWRSTLQTYAFPILGALPVQEVDTELVLRVLTPIWSDIPETASRVRQRIERVLNWSKVRGYRDGENPAQWRGHLDQLLPAKSKVRQVQHHAALDFREMPSFIQKLRAETSTSARAMEFLILTAARTGEVLGARWDEIDLEKRVWIIDGSRMKAARDHRVPLSPRAVVILQALAKIRENAFVFPGAKPGRGLSQMALAMVLRRMRHPDITVHGFRSSFRDWTAEATSFPREVAEMALAHTIGNAVEAAYRRGDLLEKRRELMNAWAGYCCRRAATSKVIAIA